MSEYATKQYPVGCALCHAGKHMTEQHPVGYVLSLGGEYKMNVASYKISI